MWRTPKELRKGLGSVTLKINTQHIHVRPLTWDPVAPLAVSIKYRKQKNTHGPGLPLKTRAGHFRVLRAIWNKHYVHINTLASANINHVGLLHVGLQCWSDPTARSGQTQRPSRHIHSAPRSQEWPPIARPRHQEAQNGFQLFQPSYRQRLLSVLLCFDTWRRKGRGGGGKREEGRGGKREEEAAAATRVRVSAAADGQTAAGGPKVKNRRAVLDLAANSVINRE